MNADNNQNEPNADEAPSELTRLEKTFTHFLTENHEPVLIMGVATAFLLAAFLALGGWIWGNGNVATPLLVAGLCVIILGVYLNKGALAVTLGVLIVGVLVAPEHYLLRITHMVSDADTPFEQYAKRYAGEGPEAAQPDIDEITARIITTLEEQGVEVSAKARGEVSRVVSEETVQAVARRVYSRDAYVPLVAVVAGEIGQLVEEFGTTEFFQADMAFLRAEGLIEFEGVNYRAATPTRLGRRVADVGFVGERAARAESPFDAPRPPHAEMPELEIDGAAVEAEFEYDGKVSWYRFMVEEASNLRIHAQSELGDPIAQLYGPNNDYLFLERNDDGGQNVNVEFNIFLEPGEYFLGVRNLNPVEADYQVSIETVSLDDLTALVIGGDALEQPFAPTDSGAMWFSFYVEEPGAYALSASSELGDPVIVLYGPERLKMIGSNDDRVDSNDAYLESVLGPGRHFLAVKMFSDEAEDFTVRVRKLDN